jgi:N-acyl-L-homoserine lactone synthetase
MSGVVIKPRQLGQSERRSALRTRRDQRWPGEIGCGRASTDIDRAACARLRGDVYAWEKKWIPRSRLVEGLEFDEDDARSVHLLARRRDEPVGTARLILPRARQPLPVEALLAEPLTSGRSGGEVSRLAVARHARGDSAVMMVLVRALYETAVEHDIDDFYALVEEPFYRHLLRLGFPFRPVGLSRWIYRSWNFPVRLEVARLAGPVAAFFSHRDRRTRRASGGVA